MATKKVGGSMRNTGAADAGEYTGCIDSTGHRVGVPKKTSGTNSFFGGFSSKGRVAPGLTTGEMLKGGLGKMPRRNPEV